MRACVSYNEEYVARFLTKLLSLLALAGVLVAQTPTVHELEQRPVFRVEVVERVTAAINYQHRSGATTIAFSGTPLMPLAEGEAKVESKRGYIEIDAQFKRMRPPMMFGAEYLTYVMWAITPEGRAANLGEVLVKNERSKLNVTTELQVFGLVVTAEPYFAVRQPSDLVVLENEVRRNTKGIVTLIDAKYELLKRGQYEPLANPLMLTLDPKVPLELYEARNAVQIAKASGADTYADDTFLKAESSLRRAEAYQARDAGDKPVAMMAREAVQRAEDAREIAVRRQEEELLAREREEAVAREAEARAAAEAEARRRAEAEKREAEQRAEAERKAREQAEEMAAERKRLEQDLASARQIAQKAARQLEETLALLDERTQDFQDERRRWDDERLRQEAEETERLRRLEELNQAERRLRILGQLNRVFTAQDIEEALAVELSDALFEPGAAALSVDGREKLAMLAGILIAYPGLAFRVDVPGPVAKDEPGQQSLLDGRASEVRQYLMSQNVPEMVSPRAATVLEEKVPLTTAADGLATEQPSLLLLIRGEPIALPLELEESEPR